VVKELFRKCPGPVSQLQPAATQKRPSKCDASRTTCRGSPLPACWGSFLPLLKMDPHHQQGSFLRPRRGFDPHRPNTVRAQLRAERPPVSRPRPDRRVGQTHQPHRRMGQTHQSRRRVGQTPAASPRPVRWERVQGEGRSGLPGPTVSDRSDIFKLPSPRIASALGVSPEAADADKAGEGLACDELSRAGVRGSRRRASFPASQPFSPSTLVPAFGGAPTLDLGRRTWTYVQLSRE
jgi:hypothetical protein